MLAALAMPFGALAQTAPGSLDQDHAVLDTFEVMCNLELPVFADISAKASAMHMLRKDSTSAPSANGALVRHETWLGKLTTGPFALLLDEMTGAKGTVTSCAVAAQVPNADAFRAAMIHDMKVSPDTPQTDENGQRSTEWRDIYGPGTALILRSVDRAENPSVMVKLVSMRPRQ